VSGGVDDDRFFNEWSSLALISSLAPADQFAVRLYGYQVELRLLIIEDLGDGPSLADCLLGNDATAAETALIAYMRSLGRMHAATAGQIAASTAYVAPSICQTKSNGSAHASEKR
jgi:hypothetical protein